MKFKVGDYVKVREWNDMEREYGLTSNGNINCHCIFSTNMTKLCGRTMYVKEVIYDSYKLSTTKNSEELPFYFSDDMLVPYNIKHLVEEEKEMESNEFNKFFNSLSDNEKSVSVEEFSRISKEAKAILNEYGYDCDHVEDVIDEWAERKANLIGLFKRHPNYNGNFQIVFDTDYEKGTDYNTIKEVFCCFNAMLKESCIKKACVFSLSELRAIRSKLISVFDYCTKIQDFGYDVKVNGMDMDCLYEEYKKFSSYHDMYYRLEYFLGSDGYIYTYNNEGLKFYNVLQHFVNNCQQITQYIDKKIAWVFNEYFPELKAREGQRFMKVFIKMCKIVGIDKNEKYNKQIARLGDAITVLKIKRHTVLSINPIDYWTMSFGDNWSSCHTIDKTGIRDMPNSYEGQYSAGTESYMLDGTSLVYYTVDASYDGDSYELQPKHTRQMFHLGEDKLVQGRLYPQGNDGAEAAYKETREIVQKVIADCFGVPNYWNTKTGEKACGDAIHEGDELNYKDYFEFGYCKVSYLKTTDKTENKSKIHIGRSEILCPACGEWHSNQDAICCEYCYNGEDRFYCEYHGCYERGESIHVYNYGEICEDAYLYSGHFVSCTRCGDVLYTDDSSTVETEDGNWYCCGTCAEQDGYSKCDDCGLWFKEDELYRTAGGDLCCTECAENYYTFCEKCNCLVRSKNYDTEHDMCVDCYRLGEMNNVA